MKRITKFLLGAAVGVSAAIVVQAVVFKPVINQTEVTLKNKRFVQLEVKHAGRELVWKSSDPSVATVSQDGVVRAVGNGTGTITAEQKGESWSCKVTVKEPKKITIPTVSQHEVGYPRGCEGVSLYMALQGKGYIPDMSIDDFMKTMPAATAESDYSPETGYAGDPTKSLDSKENLGKRTTIRPNPLTEWAKQFDENAVNMEGASTEELCEVLKQGTPLVVWITNGWKEATWEEWPWGMAVTNNHAVCLVGYDEEKESYCINDTGGEPVLGEYWIEKEKFDRAYNERHYAVAIY